MTARLAIFQLAIISLLLAGRTSLLPRSVAVVESPWRSYQEAQQTFDKIIPNKTTLNDLKQLKLDPKTNPNITILNYSDVLRCFTPSAVRSTHPAWTKASWIAGYIWCAEARSAS
jgi:hypothetical protein